MNEKQKIHFLKKLVAKQKISQVEKKDLQLIAASLNIEFVETSCSECWRDLAVTCHNALLSKLAPELKRKYILRSNVDVIYHGERINSATINDEKAVKLLAANFPKRFFIKIDGEVQNK